MKIRNGFVSNSSSSSFYFYGWDESTIIKHLGVENYADKIWKVFDSFIDSIEDKLGVRLNTHNSPYNELIIGLGNSEGEFDHWMEYWEDYECEPPSPEQIELIDRIAKELNLPKPEFYKATWFDG